ncbi:hypothetical protein Y695_02969 [Hydrogenophaga sp. T4]|nr:hypothetical protein Y695_02969 [Hydrogenophaga sp. T4]
MCLRLLAMYAKVSCSSWGLRARMAWRICSETWVTLSSSSATALSCGTRVLPVKPARSAAWFRLVYAYTPKAASANEMAILTA